ADRVGRDQDALEEHVRAVLHDVAVLRRARLGLVGVDDHVLGLGRVALDEAPLHARREARAAAAAKARGLDLVDDRRGLHLEQSLAQRLVAAGLLLVDVERVQVRGAEPARQQVVLALARRAAELSHRPACALPACGEGWEGTWPRLQAARSWA